MSEALVAAVVAASTSLIISVVGPWLARAFETERERKLLVSSVNLQHLAPLRQQLAEAAFRNHHVLQYIRGGHRRLLTRIDDITDVSTAPLAWFAGDGCYLMSTAYLTSCMFAELERLRDAYPFLRLQNKQKDTELTALALRVRLAFAGKGGVAYVVQAAIGADMISADGKLVGYQGFCEAVQDGTRGVWYGQLIHFYRMLADGQELDLVRLQRAIVAMEELSHFLDRAVGVSASVSSRMRLEAEEHSQRYTSSRIP